MASEKSVGMSDFNWKEFEAEAVERLLNGEDFGGKDGILAPMIKRLLEASLAAELDLHLAEEKSEGKRNRRNGLQSKRLKTQYGEIDLVGGRDRAGSFEPRIVGKRQVTLGKGLDDKILSMYAKGMSMSDIGSHFEDLYGMGLSPAKISAITDKVLPVLDEWRNRPLERVYAFVWMDALVFKVRHNGRIETRAVYCVIGCGCDGKKDLLGLYISEEEGAKFWLSVLSDLQVRGVEDVLIACIDNLSGFAGAINSVFPNAKVQLCVVHQIRNSLKYITSEDAKAFLADLKKVYRAVSRESAEHNLAELEGRWGGKYPVVIRSWKNNWARLSEYFSYSKDIRRVIYTTNTVEGFNRQIRKVTKSKSVFPNDTAVLKMVFLAAREITKKWTSPMPKWALVAQQLAIEFGDRMELAINIGDGSKG